MLKISVISRVRSTNKITDICKTFDELALVFTEKNVIVFFECLNPMLRIKY